MCHYSGGFGYAPHGSQSGMIVMRRRKRETLSAAVRSKPITDKQTPLDPYIHLDRLIRFSSSSSTSCSGRDETVCLTGPSGPTPRCAEQKCLGYVSMKPVVSKQTGSSAQFNCSRTGCKCTATVTCPPTVTQTKSVLHRYCYWSPYPHPQPHVEWRTRVPDKK